MTKARNQNPHIFQGITLRRWLVVAFVVSLFGSAIWAARVSQAEFEVPLVDTTDFVSTEFRSVWGYFRSTRWNAFNSGPNYAGGTIYENYEAFAVGQPVGSENGTTSLYRYDGTLWEKMMPQGSSIMDSNYQINAVGGQKDTGAGYAEIKFLGRQGGTTRQAYMLTSVNFPGDIISGTTYNYRSDPKLIGKAMLNNYANPDSPYRVDFLDNSDVALTAPNYSELYAIDMALNFGGSTLAGGLHGWLAVRNRGLDEPCTTELYKDPNTATCATAAQKAKKEKWNLFQLNDAARAPTTSDNITGVKYVNTTSAYVTTSTFPNDAASQPKQPFLHDCSGSQTSKLFRVDGSARYSANWTLLKTIVGECFYGVTATALDQPTVNNGPLQTEVWIASSKGIRRVTDDNSAAPASSLVKDTTVVDPNADIVNHAVYGIVSAYERSGNGQQLLLNGDFQSWTKKMIGVDASDPANDPTGYTIAGQASYTKDASGTCGNGTRDLRMIDRGGGNWAIQIEPSLSYDSNTCTTPRDWERSRVVSVGQPIDLSDVEGTRFRVSGNYKVTYVADDPDWAGHQPVIRQGGVTTNCSGANPPNNVDCPYSNMRELRTLTSSADDTTNVPGNSGGYVPFAFEFTRSQNQLQTPIIGHAGVPWLSDGGFKLEIRCQATFGVHVECDNLKIETVSEPSLPARSVVSVVGVGERGLTLINRDAVGTPTVWTVDDKTILNLAGGNDITLNSASAAGGGHIFAAGTGTALLQRSPGNISGFVWLGATQTGSSGNAALGWVAANCANFKNAAAKSLCQRQSQSFGLSLEDNKLIGRGWFGKQLSAGAANDDTESRDLGTCQNPARKAGLPAGEPYNMTGSCDTTESSATFRRCFANPNKACLRDFDCYGRCTGDEAALCLTDNDCSGTKLSTPPSLANSRLNGAPASNLICGTAGSSPNACTAAGWLTFNANDLPTTPVNQQLAPDGSTLGVAFTEATGELNGWARFMTLANSNDPNYQANEGWVKFRGPVTDPAGTKIYGAQNCATSVTESRCSNNLTQSCVDSSICGTGKCVHIATCKFGFDQSLQSCKPSSTSPSCVNYCEGNTSQPCTNDDECALYGQGPKACQPIGYCSNTLNNPSTTCTTDADCTTAGSFCVYGAVCAVGAANSCNRYGVDHDQTTGKFQGFAWSAEYGWVDFRSIQKGTTRFLQTRLGDVYSGGDINSRSSTTSCNATYLISAAGAISNFCTSLPANVLPNVKSTQALVPTIPITSSKNDYSNALGRFDLTGLETPQNSTGLNKYGMTIETISPEGANGSIASASSPLNDSASITLGKKVYIANCAGFGPSGNECTIDHALKFKNGASGENGAGILVVNGNLRISNNLQYLSSSINDLRQLASLVVVVRGDLNIDNTVTNVIGAYYVTGTIYTTPTATATSSDNRYPLTVRGLMIAHNFEFNRKFAGTVESPLPSELFIFDGRLQSNPLPGMTDFASSLPNNFNSTP